MNRALLDEGDGPAIILSHGTLLDCTMYQHQVDALKDRYRVIAYTSRAGTERYGDRHTLDDLVDDCISVADQAGVDRFVVGGLSVGGMMAIEAALKFPERLAGLILIGTMANDFTSDEKDRYSAILDPMDTEELISQEFADTFVPVIFGKDTIADRFPVVQDWVDKWRVRPSRSVWCEYKSWIDKQDRRPRLHEIQLPTLIIHGHDDGGIPVSRAHETQRLITDAELLVVPSAGHIAPLEQPDIVNEALRSFLDRIPRW